MRYIMKGGVWKNSEDQILKAAIMKYGLNQWSRISSLLQRKSAKQCKQRWYQWLDPSIKKTQWSRSEDQKLLQLARVFPSQWRTIAPYVGRTPTQCFQRYQKLLDQAQGKSSQQTDDLKRLGPRQIDPNPQTKPARLDPIDMDEDQKEMLAEVRVRLANTKGKKAKRKERQKIIQQARRLAQLQKIRQLEMAGVDNIPTAKQIKRMRQKQDINYNKQIPFKRQIPEFVYKVQANQTSKNTFFASTISLQTLQGKRRDVQEQLQRKLDKKRIKRLKDTDYKAMMALKSRFQKPVSMPINLPQPQLNEKDLQDMKKYNITTPLNSLMLNTPLGMTPQNKVMLSAKINFSLNHRQMTPIGEDREEEQVDGVEGLNYLKQIQRKQKDQTKMRSIDRIISQRVKTPLTHQWQEGQSKIKNLFKNLRKPENIVQFQIPEQEQQQGKEDQIVMDAQQNERIEQQISHKKLQQKLNSRNKALQSNLQRIKQIPTKLHPNEHNQCQKLIQKQILNMLYSDSIDFPLQELHLPQNHQFQYTSVLSSTQKQKAQSLIKTQLQSMSQFRQLQLEKAYQLSHKRVSFDFKNKKIKLSQKPLQDKQVKANNMHSFINKIDQYKKVQKNLFSLQKKARKYLGGYQKIISSKIEEINNLQNQLQNLQFQKNTLLMLSRQQQSSSIKRLQRADKFYKIIYNSI